VPDGEMRRPPQPWEKKLARLTSIVGGAGISSSGDGTGVVPPTPVPGSGGGTEPAPVLPAPGAFIKPSTPTLLGQVQGINVIWDGLNSASELWPYDTSWVEIHMSTAGTAFTPGTATLKGRLTRPGAYSVGGLTAGTAYYFKLRGADPAGNYTDPSDAATGYTGQTIAGDLGVSTVGTAQISFNARTIGGVTNSVQATAPSNPLTGDVWLDTSPGTAVIHKVYNGSTWVTNAWGSASIAAGQITALQLAAGAVTAGAITAGTVNGWYIQGGTISGNYITGGTIAGGYISGGTMSAGYISGGTIATGYLSGGTVSGAIVSGGTVKTSTGNNRVEMANTDQLRFFVGGSETARLEGYSNGLLVYTTGVWFNTADFNDVGDINSLGDVSATGSLSSGGAGLFSYSGSNRALRVAATGEVYSYGIDDNTTANAANVRVGASAQLLKSTSSVRRKTALTPLDDGLQGVPPDKVADFSPSVDYYDVLSLTPTEFESLSPADAAARSLGFIAEDVAMKLPWACDWDDVGQPDAVQDRPILAALVQVVKDQQATITALTARIEALEG